MKNNNNKNNNNNNDNLKNHKNNKNNNMTTGENAIKHGRLTSPRVDNLSYNAHHHHHHHYSNKNNNNNINKNDDKLIIEGNKNKYKNTHDNHNYNKTNCTIPNNKNNTQNENNNNKNNNNNNKHKRNNNRGNITMLDIRDQRLKITEVFRRKRLHENVRSKKNRKTNGWVEGNRMERKKRNEGMCSYVYVFFLCFKLVLFELNEKLQRWAHIRICRKPSTQKNKLTHSRTHKKQTQIHTHAQKLTHRTSKDKQTT